MPSLADADALDRADPIGSLRGEFVIDDAGPIYADGNSLGRVAHASADALRRLVEEEWGRTLIGSWDDWFDLPESVGDLVGTTMLGARPGDTLVADSTTVNFYKLVVAATRAAGGGRRVVVTDRGNFPTDRFVLQGLDVDLVLVDDDPSPEVVERALALHGERVALVTLSLVGFRSGALLDLPAITASTHRAGARVLWDLSHAAGAVAVNLAEHEVDLAVGCTYKYLNGGPGSPAFLYVRGDLHDVMAQPIQGWFGAADQFEMGPAYTPAPGIRRFLSGTPPVAGLRSVEAAVAVLSRVGVEALAAKGRQLTAFVIECVDEHLARHGFEVVTPRDPAARGAHVSVRHPDAWRICRALIERAGVVPDFRPPDIVRLGFAPAYTRYVDVLEAVERIAATVGAGVHLEMPSARARIT